MLCKVFIKIFQYILNLKEMGRGFALCPEHCTLSVSPCPDLSLKGRRFADKDKYITHGKSGHYIKYAV
jgi:hypothetical protein